MATTAADQAPAKAHTQAADDVRGLPGQFGRAIHFTMLGAGSAFTPRLVSDVLQIPGADAGHVALVDIDTDRHKTRHQLVQKLIDQHGKDGAWTISATDDRTTDGKFDSR